MDIKSRCKNKRNYLYNTFLLPQGKDNSESEALLKLLNDEGRIHMVPSKSKGIYYLRFAICATRTESKDVAFAWKVVSEVTDKYLKSCEKKVED